MISLSDDAKWIFKLYSNALGLICYFDSVARDDDDDDCTRGLAYSSASIESGTLPLWLKRLLCCCIRMSSRKPKVLHFTALRVREKREKKGNVLWILLNFQHVPCWIIVNLFEA